MEFLMIFCLLLTTVLAHAASIVPSKTVTPLLDIFSSKNRKLSETMMEVRVSTYSKRGAISKGKKTAAISMDDYLKARSQSSAVYQMQPNESYLKRNDDKRSYYGTAFHIGENLVLTNLHVLSQDFSNTTYCAGFELYQQDQNKVFACKKVHYCNVEHDVCLIEMKPMKNCLNSFCTKYEMIEMKSRESLKLKEYPMVNFEERSSIIMTAIGNTMGYGIHFSQGRGVSMGQDRFDFYAPLRKGNSGGPVIGEDGLVWGVVKKESLKTVGPDAYNVAASMNLVIELIKENVEEERVLKNFMNAIEI